MKNLVSSLVVLSLILAYMPSNSFSSGFVDYQFDSKHSLSVAPEVYEYKYEEPGLMKMEGKYEGIHIDYFYSAYPDPEDTNNPFKRTKHFFAGLETRYAEGSVDYESNGTGDADDIDDYVIETRAILGFEAMVCESLDVSPYIGFGYRYLNNDFGGRMTTTGHFGYERESNYYYIPIGASLIWSVASHTAIGGTIEADLFLYGKQISHLDDVHPMLEKVENDQNSGYGGRASVFIEQEIGFLSIFIEPYIRYWDIEDSDVTVDSNALAWIEPENDTVETGVKAGLRGTF